MHVDTDVDTDSKVHLVVGNQWFGSVVSSFGGIGRRVRHAGEFFQYLHQILSFTLRIS